MPSKHINLVVSGQVQGVFYRRTAKVEAEKLGIGGWVRNKTDGTVEISVSGEEKNIAEFIKWCKKGPPFAKVKNVEVKDRKPEDYDEFSIVD